MGFITLYNKKKVPFASFELKSGILYQFGTSFDYTVEYKDPSLPRDILYAEMQDDRVRFPRRSPQWVDLKDHEYIKIAGFLHLFTTADQCAVVSYSVAQLSRDVASLRSELDSFASTDPTYEILSQVQRQKAKELDSLRRQLREKDPGDYYRGEIAELEADNRRLFIKIDQLQLENQELRKRKRS